MPLPKLYALLTRAERRRAAGLLGLMIGGMVLETLGIGMVIPALAFLVQPDPAAAYPRLRPWLDRLGSPTRNELVVGGVLILVGIYVVKAVYLGFVSWRQGRFAFGLQARLSQQLFSTYLRQPYTFHLQRNSAQLGVIAVGEVGQFILGTVLPATVLVTELLVVIGIAALLLILEPVGAASVAVVLAVAAWTFDRIFRRKVTEAAVQRQRHDSLRMLQLQQGLGGVKDVKLLGREEWFLDRYSRHNVESARVMQLQQLLLRWPRLWFELLGVVSVAIIILTTLAQGGDVSTTVPALGLFAAAAFRLMPSMTRVMGAVQQMRYSAPVITLLCDEIALGDAVAAPGDPLPPLRDCIEVKGLRYAYPGTTRPVLDDVSVVISRGESVGLVGPSGSGKSTLVDVILGLLPPTEGRVSVDGADVATHLRGWQRQVGYVPQTIYLTDDTLRRNIAFGIAAAEIDDAAIARAIRAAQLEALVASLPDGLDTVVGERGTRLSGGQRQRVGIARALYHDPAVLVLDEAASALDTATEKDILDAVSALEGDRTILIVAHRMSTVARCDRLYRLEGGCLQEAGVPVRARTYDLASEHLEARGAGLSPIPS